MKKLSLYLMLIATSVFVWPSVSASSLPAASAISGPIDWDVSIYPNPNHGAFSIMVINNASDVEVVVFNVIGKSVFRMSTVGQQRAKIDLSDLEHGLYFVQFIDRSRSQVITRRMYIE